MRKKLQGGRYLTLETRKDGTKFTSRGLREAAESLQGISRSYNDKQAQLVDEVGHLAALQPSQAAGGGVFGCCTKPALNAPAITCNPKPHKVAALFSLPS